MKSETRLDSAIFQLTPTRTRCDLVIIANGKTEKLASGLLNPFLAHLKAAQDQIAKGGYSIMLEPDPGRDASWFTKGTVQRFVRFVSTPEILERVNTIESEILQIEEAISIQSNDNPGLSTQVEDHQTRSIGSIEGNKPVSDADEEKAIVLYKPGVHPPETNGSTTQEENSKVQLLKVLETRKTVLQKEQGMAFARAVAAGFDMDHMAPLISFSQCFGATRLMEACIRFMDLWKGKHETGQWLEIEAAEVMSSRSDLSSMIASGIMLSSDTKNQNEFREAWPESHGELGTESNGKSSDGAAADMSSDYNRDKRQAMDPQVPLGHHEYFQGQFQHPMFPQWPIQSPPGAPPVFQAYPIQGMPYYQNYPGNVPFFQPPYPPMEDPRFNAAQRMGQKRHSMDSKDSNTESEIWEMPVSNTRSQDGSELEKEGSQGRESHRKSGRSGKKKSGMVVIRNINYITSKRQNTSGSESQSASDPETDEDDAPDVKRRNSTRSSKSKGSHTRSSDTGKAYDKDETVYGQEADGGSWNAFQNFLLRDDENTHVVDQGMFSMEEDIQKRKHQNTFGGDPIVPHGRDLNGTQEERMTEFDTISGKLTCMPKAANDEVLISQGKFPSGSGTGSRDDQADVQITEVESGRGGYRRTTNDDFMIYGQEYHSDFTNSLPDPMAGIGIERADNLDRSSSHNVTDESFIVPLRENSQDQVGTNSRTAIDMDSELPSALQKTEDSSSRIKAQINYEPDDLSLMPERGTEGESIGYDPAVDYKMQVHVEDALVEHSKPKEDVVTGVKEGSKKSDKDKKSKVTQDGLEKRKTEVAMRKGKPSKMTPLAEAQARAERLRAFKADLQKVKKEKEEEGIKRLEALKRERQKRIEARGSLSTVQSPLPSQQTRPRLPTKLSPSSHKGSKFSDSEPGPLSPLQRLPIRTASVGSNDSHKTTTTSRLNSGSHSSGNGLSRSVSSLPELKKENDEPKAATMRIRRLSEPKTSYSHHVSSGKLRSADPVLKPKLSDGPESKKISAIMSLDRTKAATLPELKIRTSKRPSDMVQSKSATKAVTQKANANKSSVSSETTKLRKNSEKTSQHSSGDENPVIEKTVVMLEPEVPPVPVAQVSEERMEIKKGSDNEDKEGEKTEVDSEHVTIHAPASPFTMHEAIQDASECQLDEQPISSEMTKDYAMGESPKFSSISITETPYQAPYARASSLEDPCTTNLEYTKAPPPNSETGAASTETAKAHVSDFTDLLEALEKPKGKESSKGFRRLLKFGRKSHSSAAAERNVELDKLSIDGSVADDHGAITTSSNEVPTLKNLISQDETPTAGTTTQKASRSFSLLSPFRSKTSEKKLTT